MRKSRGTQPSGGIAGQTERISAGYVLTALPIHINKSDDAIVASRKCQACVGNPLAGLGSLV